MADNEILDRSKKVSKRMKLSLSKMQDVIDVIPSTEIKMMKSKNYS